MPDRMPMQDKRRFLDAGTDLKETGQGENVLSPLACDDLENDGPEDENSLGCPCCILPWSR